MQPMQFAETDPVHPADTPLTSAAAPEFLLEHQCGLAFEQAQYAWCRWHFTVLEMLDLFGHAAYREAMQSHAVWPLSFAGAHHQGMSVNCRRST